MATIQFKGEKGALEVTVNAGGDWLQCLMVGLMAAAPAFLEAFMKCLQGAPTTEFNPGDRQRCQ